MNTDDFVGEISVLRALRKLGHENCLGMYKKLKRVLMEHEVAAYSGLCMPIETIAVVVGLYMLILSGRAGGRVTPG